MSLDGLRPGLSPEGVDFRAQIFGNSRYLAVEVGPGRGEFLIASARTQPQRSYLAIENSRRRAAALQEEIDRQGLTNARVLAGDARCILELIPDRTVDTYVILFPDPWWKRRHRQRRVMTAALIANIVRTLVSEGELHFVTDVAEYYATVQSLLDGFSDLSIVQRGPCEEDRTSFARKARARGGAIWGSVHRRYDGRSSRS